MRQHIITRSYTNLKGFSTDSIYLRPPNISDEAINIHRDPDGTFTPRRGFQCQIADIGGLGMISFDSPCRCGIELVCVNRNGNLYRRITQTINIAYNTASTEAWFQFTILTNPNIFNNTPGWSFEPWSLTPWSNPSGESITFQGFVKSAAIVVGNQTNVSTINVQAGHVVQVGDMISVMNQESREIVTRTISATGATTLTFVGGTLSVNNNDRVDVFIEQLFLRGFDVNTPYPISQFLTVLNSINGITAYTEGPTNFPAAFIPIQESTTVTNKTNTNISYYYWEEIPAPINPILPGSADVQNQNSLLFENASFCVFDEILYCTNGYDFVVKYDGQNAYLAGMPKGERPTVTTAGAGALLANDIYYYAITYEQKDNATHVIEGQISDSFIYTVGGSNESTTVTILDLDSNSGYNTNAALASGSTDSIYGPDGQGNYYHFVGTLAGQTLIVGDTAYYEDRAIAMVTTNPSPTTNLPILPGYGVLVGDTVSFIDATGATIRRVVVDINTTVSPNIMEISGPNVDASNNPTVTAYVESSVYGHVGIVSGNQTNVTTINLLSSAGPVHNNLTANDLIKFTDNLGNFLERTVVSRTISSITIDQPTSVLDGTFIYSPTIDTNQITLKSTKPTVILTLITDPISNNLKINIYRSKGSPNGELVELSLIETIPNDSFSTSQTYVDNLSDDELARQPALDKGDQIDIPNPPPKCKYLLTYQNLVIYAGGSRKTADTEWSQDAFYYSKGNQPEAVPAATNFQLVPSNDDIVSGVATSGSSLIIGKDKSIYAISGDLLTSQFQVTPVAPGSNIGVAAHATMRSVGGLLYFLSNTGGVYSMAETQMFPTDEFGDPVPLSKPIDVLFRTKPYSKDKQFVYKRAVAVNYTTDNEYWLFLPCENISGTLRNANDNSVILCFDYLEKNWFLWKNINAAGGFAIVDDDIFWQERRFSGFVGNTSNLYRQHRNYRLIDYADHTQTIPVFWSSSWEDLNYPQVRKKFIRCMLLLDRVDSLYQLNEPFLIFSTYLDRFPDNKDTIAPVTTVNNSIQWGSAWSWKKWSGVVDSFIRVNLRNGTQAKSMQISLEMNKLNTSFKLNGFQLEISPEYDKTFVR